MTLGYYPFGLKQKGYNYIVNGGNSLAQKFKYNGVELNEDFNMNLYEMDLRMYDPAIARFNGIDPVTHHSMGISVAFDNNPVYWADPSGADATSLIQDLWNKTANDGKTHHYDNEGNETGTSTVEGDDIITLDSNGKVIDIVRDDSFNIFYDENGNKLEFNDLENIDNHMLSKIFNLGDQVYTQVTDDELEGEMYRTRSIYYGEGMSWLELLYFGLDYSFSSYDEYDFGFSYLQSKIGVSTKDMGEIYFGRGYIENTPFVRFGNGLTLYNIPDAGNYMWGRKAAHNMLTLKLALKAAGYNEGGSDTGADQNAITQGFNSKPN